MASVYVYDAVAIAAGIVPRALSRSYFAGGGAPGVCGRRRRRADYL